MVSQRTQFISLFAALPSWKLETPFPTINFLTSCSVPSGSMTNHFSYLSLNFSIIFAWCITLYYFLPTDLGYSPLVEVIKSLVVISGHLWAINQLTPPYCAVSINRHSHSRLHALVSRVTLRDGITRDISRLTLTTN